MSSLNDMPTVEAPAVSVSAPHVMHSDPPPNMLVCHVTVLPGCSAVVGQCICHCNRRNAVEIIVNDLKDSLNEFKYHFIVSFNFINLFSCYAFRNRNEMK